jgi:hypothetical protein
MADSNLKVPLRDLPLEQGEPESEVQERSTPLRSGHRVLIRNGPGAQAIEVRGPDGTLQVEVIVTDQGPVVRLTAGRMEIATTEDVDVQCRTFKVHAERGVEIESGDKLLLKSADDTDIEAGGDLRAKGETIWLN